LLRADIIVSPSSIYRGAIRRVAPIRGKVAGTTLISGGNSCGTEKPRHRTCVRARATVYSAGYLWRSVCVYYRASVSTRAHAAACARVRRELAHVVRRADSTCVPARARARSSIKVTAGAAEVAAYAGTHAATPRERRVRRRRCGRVEGEGGGGEKPATTMRSPSLSPARHAYLT